MLVNTIIVMDVRENNNNIICLLVLITRDNFGTNKKVGQSENNIGKGF